MLFTALLAVLCVSASALADPLPVKNHPLVDDHPRARAGIGFDVGIPDGVAVGLVVSPWLPWMKVEGAATYNFMSEGFRGSVTLDPFKFPVGLTLTGDLGGYFPSALIGVHNSPTVAYTYENILLGVEFGNRSGCRFFFRGGLTHLDINASNFQNTFTLPMGTTVGDPHVSAWAAPALKIGLQWLF